MKLLGKMLLALLVGIPALAGMLFCGCVVYLLLDVPEEGPRGFVGLEEARKSYAWHGLPLPEQAEPQNFPMAVDHRGMCDFSGFIIFAADADWQELFRRFQARKAAALYGDTKLVAEHYAEWVGDERITSFIRSRKWQLFHEAQIWHTDEHYVDATALRDEAGEYVLMFYRLR